MSLFDPRPTAAERRTHAIGKWLARFAFLAAIAGGLLAAYYPFWVSAP